MVVGAFDKHHRLQNGADAQRHCADATVFELKIDGD